MKNLNHVILEGVLPFILSLSKDGRTTEESQGGVVGAPLRILHFVQDDKS